LLGHGVGRKSVFKENDPLRCDTNNKRYKPAEFSGRHAGTGAISIAKSVLFILEDRPKAFKLRPHTPPSPTNYEPYHPAARNE
jgi:hypothetical protein